MGIINIDFKSAFIVRFILTKLIELLSKTIAIADS